MAKQIRVCHLYGNLLNTYGDNGNLLVFTYYAKKQGYEVKSDIVSLGQRFEPEKYDFVFIGGGQDYEQHIVSADIADKKAGIAKYIEGGGVMLAVCGGYQLLGKYYIGANCEKIPGISVLNFKTESLHDKRFIGEVEIHNERSNEAYFGFENHNGLTFLGEGVLPLGKVVSGNGNNGKDGGEGAVYKNTFCTYLHGPVLARNKNFAMHILRLITEGIVD